MLTTQQLVNMFAMQEQLNSRVNPDWKRAEYDWSLAIMTECIELADQIGWKWWKDQPQASLAQIHLEVVDIWHFVLSIYLELGCSKSLTASSIAEPDYPPEGCPMYPAYAIQRAKLLAATICYYPLDLSRMVPEFLILMRAVRLSFNELYVLYMAKAMLNLFRWSHGYQEGTYRKQWGDVEDNVYLESILRDRPNLPHEQITALLQQRYQETTA